jgi:dihydroorotate dehydrogenase electron transfer subunit
LKQVSSVIISNTEIGPHIHLIGLEAPSIVETCKPGQFIMVKCGDELVLRRPMSIHRVSAAGELSVLFNLVGAGTSWLSKREKGDRVDILGPFGNGFIVGNTTTKILLIAGGMGIAPLVYLAEEALAMGKHVTILMGSSDNNCLYPVDSLPGDARVVVATEDGSAGHKGMVTDMLLSPDYKSKVDQVFACGPLNMYKTMFQYMESDKLDGMTQVSLEIRMGCGAGACYGCSIKTKNGMKLVCKDGPIFLLNEVLWQEVKL